MDQITPSTSGSHRMRVMPVVVYASGISQILVLFFTLTLTAAALINNDTNVPNSYKLLIAFQAPLNVSYPFSALRLGAALQIAVDKVNTNPSFLGNYSLEFVYTDSDCNPKTSLGAFIRQVWKRKVSAIFGPACPEEAEVRNIFIDLMWFLFCPVSLFSTYTRFKRYFLVYRWLV